MAGRRNPVGEAAGRPAPERPLRAPNACGPGVASGAAASFPQGGGEAVQSPSLSAVAWSTAPVTSRSLSYWNHSTAVRVPSP